MDKSRHMVRPVALAAVLLLAACGGGEPPPPPTATETATLVPSLTNTLPPTLTPVPPTPQATDTPEITEELTPTQVVITVIPEIGVGVAPPVDLTLPDGWASRDYLIPGTDVDGVFIIYNVSVYGGPVSGGQGTIILVWGFQNLTLGSPIDGRPVAPINLWSDGLRLWRLLVVTPTCNVGTDVQRDFSVGGLPATGTYVNAFDCPDDLDNWAGWFAGLQETGINFLFYAFTDPETFQGAAAGELQAILDSARFRVAEFLTATPTFYPVTNATAVSTATAVPLATDTATLTAVPTASAVPTLPASWATNTPAP